MKMMQLKGWVVLVFLLVGRVVFSATTTWQGGGTGLWSESGNWSGGLPQSGDTAIFNDSTSSDDCTIDTDIDVGNLYVTNYSGSLTFGQGTNADMTVSSDLYLDTDATIVCTYSSLTNNIVGVVTNGSGRVITVGGDAVILGTIDASEQGFPANTGPGKSSRTYYGGTYGGKGVADFNAAGPVYGSLTEPTSLGSGGGTRTSGGGAVKLDVGGTLTIDGLVTANGEFWDNGGSGGSIWIDADELRGDGSITASGGGSDRPGGGGRVAIYYTSSTFSGEVDIRGDSLTRWDGPNYSQPGTLWEPKRFDGLGGSAESPADVVISTSYQYFFPDSRTNYWNLSITNAARVYFHDSTINVSNLYVEGTGSDLKKASILRCDVDSNGDYDKTGVVDFNVSGSIDLRNNGDVYLSDAGITASSISVVDYSLLQLQQATTIPTTWNNGEFGLTNNSTIYLPAQTYTFDGFDVPAGSTVVVLSDTTAINEDAGGSADNPYGIGVTVNCKSATIAGDIDGEGNGFDSFEGPGGYEWPYYGAAHGGTGVDRTTLTYGNLTRPSEIGSGGSYSKGGGSIKIVAEEEISLDGTITVQGQKADNNHGSPGSVWLICDELSGSGTINASGSGNDRASGGGRTALEYRTSSFTGENLVNGYWDGSGFYASKTGSMYICESPLPQGNGVILDTEFTTDSDDVKIVRDVSRWTEDKRVMTWTDSSTLVDGTALANTATYTLTGVDTSLAYKVFEDDVEITTWSQVGDVITIPDIAVSHTVSLSSITKGTVLFIQ